VIFFYSTRTTFWRADALVFPIPSAMQTSKRNHTFSKSCGRRGPPQSVGFFQPPLLNFFLILGRCRQRVCSPTLHIEPGPFFSCSFRPVGHLEPSWTPLDFLVTSFPPPSKRAAARCSSFPECHAMTSPSLFLNRQSSVALLIKITDSRPFASSGKDPTRGAGVLLAFPPCRTEVTFFF